MNLALPTDVSTPDQLSAIDMELSDYISQLRSTRSHSAPDKSVANMSSALKETLHQNKIDADNTAALEDLHSLLQNTLNRAPVAHLTMAGLPTKDIKKQLTLWFRTEVHPEVLITFTARPDIGGGVVAFVGSHVYDYSFRRKILDNKKRISELAFDVRQ